MAETVQGGIWRWTDIMNDLDIQGGLSGVVINPFSCTHCSCDGQTELGTIFALSWVQHKMMLVSVSQDEPKLIDAFSNVVGHKPLLKYVCKESGLLTFEWNWMHSANEIAANIQENAVDIVVLPA